MANYLNYEECRACRTRNEKQMRELKERQIRRQNTLFIILIIIVTLMFAWLLHKLNNNIQQELATVQTFNRVEMIDPIETVKPEIVHINKKEFASMPLPTETTGEFKTYMDYRTITDRTSKQWNLQQLATTNEDGFRMFNNHYLVAVGSFYGTEVGKELQITLENGVTFSAIIGDLKMDIHTDENNQFVPKNGNIVEFIVDVDKLDKNCKLLGDISSSGLEGGIVMIKEEKDNERDINS